MDLDYEKIIDFLMQGKFFVGISREVCEELLAKMIPIQIRAHDTLFKQDDPSDSLYIVIEGRLTAVLQATDKSTRDIGIIEKGEVVGEVGALSGAPRSLTIKALTDCLLLKIPIEHLTLFFKANPAAIYPMVKIILERSQATIKLLSGTKPYRHLLVMPANDQIQINEFVQRFKKQLESHPDVIFKDCLNEETLLNPNLLQNLLVDAEAKNKTVIILMSPHKHKNTHLWMNFLGGIYVIGDGTATANFSPPVYGLLNYSMMPFVHHVELILLQPDGLARPQNTLAWLKQDHFTLHHHIRKSNDNDYQRLIRFMSGKARGLVLSGGGSKGWAHLGVIKLLHEMKIEIDAIGGSSIGAIAGACFALDHDYENTKILFTEIMRQVGDPFEAANFTLPIVSLLSGNKAAVTLQKAFDNLCIENLWTPYYCVASNLSLRKEVVYQQGLIWESLRKSASIPGMVPPVAVDGQLFVDGSVLNNLPVDHMRSLLGTASSIIAVNLTAYTKIHTDYNFPSSLPFTTAMQIKFGSRKATYKLPSFFEVFLESLQLGSSPKESANELLADVLIRPDMSAYPPLRLVKPADVATLIDKGYQAALIEMKLKDSI